MQNLLDAIAAKLLDSTLYTSLGGRCYYDIADTQDAPYLVYSIVSTVPDRTFSERYTDAIIQFDLFSAKSAGPTQITTMYADLISLLDECSLSITGYTLVWMREMNLVTLVDDISALQDGSNILNHWAVDFECRISLNDTDGPIAFAEWLDSVISDGSDPISIPNAVRTVDGKIKVTINGVEYYIMLATA